MTDATCTIDGCKSPSKARSLCTKHYTRLVRRGTTGDGRPYGRTSCVQPGCELPHYCKDLCTRHYAALQLYGDPAQWHGPRWRGDDIDYVTAHSRVYAAKGKATGYQCSWCGQPAHHWAYDHADPDERRGGPKNLPFSPDPAHYLPACRSCHAKFDRKPPGCPRN